MKSRGPFFTFINYFLVTLGITAAIIQFFFNRSLWLDEASLALNIINRNAIQLLQPLDYLQVAPVLFLQIENFFSFLFPNSEYGLRLLPLLCYIFSLVLFYKICNQLLKNQIVISVALALFVFNHSLFYFATEVKQYMGDVFVCLLFLHLLNLKDYFARTSPVFPALIGGICLFFSNSTPIIMTGVLLFLFKESFVSKRISVSKFFSIAFVWVMCISVYYFFIIRNHPSTIAMQDFWGRENAFLQATPLEWDFYFFIGNKFYHVFVNLFTLPFKNIIVCIPLVLWGLWSVVKTKQWLFLQFFGCITITHFLLCAMQLYPFEERLILYSYPLYFFIIAIGIDYFIQTIKIPSIVFNFIMSVFVCAMCFSFFSKNHFPIEREEIKSCITYLNKNIQAGDKVYVYYGAERALNFYRQTGLVEFKNALIMGSANRNNFSAYTEELRKLHGHCWLLFSHVYQNEEQLILDFGASNGNEIIKKHQAVGANVYLYNFNFPVK